MLCVVMYVGSSETNISHDLADGVIAFFFECIVNLYEHLLHIELLRRLNAECLGCGR